MHSPLWPVANNIIDMTNVMNSDEQTSNDKNIMNDMMNLKSLGNKTIKSLNILVLHQKRKIFR